MVRAGIALVVTLVVVGWTSPAASAATCSDYSNQAEAQGAKDTLDADGDGIYCESLPCPCLRPGDSGGGGGSPTPAPKPKSSCVRPPGVLRLSVQPGEVPQHQAPFHGGRQEGLASGDGPQPQARRRPARPPAGRVPYPSRLRPRRVPRRCREGQANGDLRGLVRGINPVGWMADVAYVSSRENRSHGSSLGAKLRGVCEGTRFQYAFA
jgi:hypothetical protein